MLHLLYQYIIYVDDLLASEEIFDSLQRVWSWCTDGIRKCFDVLKTAGVFDMISSNRIQPFSKLKGPIFLILQKDWIVYVLTVWHTLNSFDTLQAPREGVTTGLRLVLAPFSVQVCHPHLSNFSLFSFCSFILHLTLNFPIVIGRQRHSRNVSARDPCLGSLLLKCTVHRSLGLERPRRSRRCYSASLLFNATIISPNGHRRKV